MHDLVAGRGRSRPAHEGQLAQQQKYKELKCLSVLPSKAVASRGCSVCHAAEAVLVAADAAAATADVHYVQFMYNAAESCAVGGHTLHVHILCSCRVTLQAKTTVVLELKSQCRYMNRHRHTAPLQA